MTTRRLVPIALLGPVAMFLPESDQVRGLVQGHFVPSLGKNGTFCAQNQGELVSPEPNLRCSHISPRSSSDQYRRGIMSQWRARPAVDR